MRSVQIKNVPDDVHQVLRQRAAKAGQSQQEYLLALLVDHARQPTLAEAFERIDRESGSRLTLEFAVETIRADRDSR
jgi:plasmid stability protein